MVNNKLIKVCGMCEGENIREVESPDIDMTGSSSIPNLHVTYAKCPIICLPMPAVSESLLTKISRQ